MNAKAEALHGALAAGRAERRSASRAWPDTAR